MDEVKLPFNNDWLQSCLQASLRVTNQLTSVTQESLVFGQGYMSYICRLKLTWSGGDGSTALPASIIFKMPSLDRLSEAFEKSNGSANVGDLDFINAFHRSECLFYTNYRSTDPDLVSYTPLCYHNQLVAEGHTGFLLMEDLSMKGKVVEIMDGLNLQQIKAAVTALAKIHGWSLLNPLWRKEILPLPPQAYKDFPTIWEQSHLALKKTCPQLYTVADEVLALYLSPKFLSLLTTGDTSGPGTVMCHGDFWTTNCLFKTNDEDRCGNELLAVIDWQNLHPGLGAEDIGRLLVSSCSVEIRRNHLGEILQLYYDTLTTKMHPTPVPFSLAEVHLSYKATLGFNSLMYMFGVPILFPVAEKRGKADRIPDMVARAVASMEDGVAALKELQILP